MDRGYLGGALALSPQHLSWLTPKDSEGRRYRTRKYPWGDWARINTDWAQGSGPKERRGPKVPLGKARTCMLGRC